MILCSSTALRSLLERSFLIRKLADVCIHALSLPVIVSVRAVTEFLGWSHLSRMLISCCCLLLTLKRQGSSTWAPGVTSHTAVDMDDFWAGALWALKIWLYLIISLIMFPAMFGFSLGISETYMTVLVKTLEVLLGFCCVFDAVLSLKQMLDTNVFLFFSGRLWRCRRQKKMSSCLEHLPLMVSRMPGNPSLWVQHCDRLGGYW